MPNEENLPSTRKSPGSTDSGLRQKIDVVGLDRHTGGRYGDCKAGQPEVNRLA